LVEVSESIGMTARISATPAGFLLLIASGVLLLRPLARFWSENENYAYGWGVPLLAAFLFYERCRCRPAPAPARENGWMRLAVAALAWAVVCLAVRLVLETEPDSRPLLWLATTLWAGALLAWIGLLGGRSWLRHFAFPILFLLAGVPWIFQCEFLLVQELMRLNAAGVAGALHLLGISARAAGNTITLSTGQLGVSEACSGIRSLQAALMMALFFGEL
jgi:exosortase